MKRHEKYKFYNYDNIYNIVVYARIIFFFQVLRNHSYIYCFIIICRINTIGDKDYTYLNSVTIKW